MQEQPGAGDLLQPAPTGLLGLLKVLGVRARLPACAVELNAETDIEATPAITRPQFMIYDAVTWLSMASRCSEKAQTAATSD